MSYSKIYSYDDFLSFLSDSGYSNAVKKKKTLRDAALIEQLVPLAAQKQSINESSDELARQAYISYLSASKSLPEKLSAKGLNGGAADNMYLSLANEYQNNYNEIGKQRQSKLNDVDNAMAKTRASSYADYMSSVSEMYDSAVEKFLEARENEEERNFDSYYNDKEYADKAADRNAQAQQNKAENQLAKDKYELEKAKLAFEAGDLSLFEKLGITPVIKEETPNNKGEGSSSNVGNAGTTDEGVNYNDLLKQLDYAVSLAQYGNFDLLCEITGMTAEEAALRFAKVEDSGYTSSQIRDAAKLFMSGDYSKNVLGILKTAYPDYSYSQIWKLWRDVAMNEWIMYIDDTYKGPKA